ARNVTGVQTCALPMSTPPGGACGGGAPGGRRAAETCTRPRRTGDARRTVAYPALVTSGRWTSITRIAVAVSAAGLVLAGCGSSEDRESVAQGHAMVPG